MNYVKDMIHILIKEQQLSKANSIKILLEKNKHNLKFSVLFEKMKIITLKERKSDTKENSFSNIVQMLGIVTLMIDLNF